MGDRVGLSTKPTQKAKNLQRGEQPRRRLGDWGATVFFAVGTSQFFGFRALVSGFPSEESRGLVGPGCGQEIGGFKTSSQQSGGGIFHGSRTQDLVDIQIRSGFNSADQFSGGSNSLKFHSRVGIWSRGSSAGRRCRSTSASPSTTGASSGT